MRFPSIPTLIRTFYAFSNTTLHTAPTFGLRALYQSPQRAIPLRSMSFLGALFRTSSKMPDTTKYPVQKTEEEWRAELGSKAYGILRNQNTERPGTGEFYEHAKKGEYKCRGCDHPLYLADHKFESACGWPAYWDSIAGAVGEKPDPTLGMMRTEIVCNNCGGHLGHIFRGEGNNTPKDQRHCVNSRSLKFVAEDGTVVEDKD
ncbi:SelR domain-containing protein [Amniculicola lignicola CBS 123094]|uniref:Peptide-methionine (R)-S-oxide reductase n=1 Tax=Amniculicola lignicola CBS 123094 TaxID=1392246 RepID=A0A6A5VXQ1_9PLEO|nr:SelR domain-containing protein [Amniculicola lignicola CBS 123094]